MKRQHVMPNGSGAGRRDAASYLPPVFRDGPQRVQMILQTSDGHKAVTDVPKILKIRVYRNGDKHFPGAQVVVRNRNEEFDHFLDRVTAAVKSSQAIRFLYSDKGMRIHHTRDVRDGERYVASTQESFKELAYGKITDTRFRTAAKSVTAKLPTISPEAKARAHATKAARYLNSVGKNKPIHFRVLKNGDVFDDGIRITFDKKRPMEWGKLLQLISDQVKLPSGAMRRLCSMRGKPLKGPEELENDAVYVAVGNGRFRSVEYLKHKPSWFAGRVKHRGYVPSQLDRTVDESTEIVPRLQRSGTTLNQEVASPPKKPLKPLAGTRSTASPSPDGSAGQPGVPPVATGTDVADGSDNRQGEEATESDAGTPGEQGTAGLAAGHRQDTLGSHVSQGHGVPIGVGRDTEEAGQQQPSPPAAKAERQLQEESGQEGGNSGMEQVADPPVPGSHSGLLVQGKQQDGGKNTDEEGQTPGSALGETTASLPASEPTEGVAGAGAGALAQLAGQATKGSLLGSQGVPAYSVSLTLGDFVGPFPSGPIVLSVIGAAKTHDQNLASHIEFAPNELHIFGFESDALGTLRGLRLKYAPSGRDAVFVNRVAVRDVASNARVEFVVDQWVGQHEERSCSTSVEVAPQPAHNTGENPRASDLNRVGGGDAQGPGSSSNNGNGSRIHNTAGSSSSGGGDGSLSSEGRVGDGMAPGQAAAGQAGAAASNNAAGASGGPGATGEASQSEKLGRLPTDAASGAEHAAALATETQGSLAGASASEASATLPDSANGGHQTSSVPGTSTELTDGCLPPGTSRPSLLASNTTTQQTMSLPAASRHGPLAATSGVALHGDDDGRQLLSAVQSARFSSPGGTANHQAEKERRLSALQRRKTSLAACIDNL
eukprot:m.20104 g.20104  ORF g.20104 m.20104 type:complete len:886 (-) comp6090_c0_seq1:357-3014(-)